jgi:hypothetical protein
MPPSSPAGSTRGRLGITATSPSTGVRRPSPGSPGRAGESWPGALAMGVGEMARGGLAAYGAGVVLPETGGGDGRRRAGDGEVLGMGADGAGSGAPTSRLRRARRPPWPMQEAK